MTNYFQLPNWHRSTGVKRNTKDKVLSLSWFRQTTTNARYSIDYNGGIIWHGETALPSRSETPYGHLFVALKRWFLTMGKMKNGLLKRAGEMAN
jgi:hypothetical protein